MLLKISCNSHERVALHLFFDPFACRRAAGGTRGEAELRPDLRESVGWKIRLPSPNGFFPQRATQATGQRLGAGVTDSKDRVLIEMLGTK
jgi:hypothetical protein